MTEEINKNSKSARKQEKALKPIAIGTKERPIPLYRTEPSYNDEGRIIAKTGWYLQNEQSDTLEDQVAIHSEKSPKEVMAMLYRNLPKPTMLEIFWKGMRLRMPNSRRRLEFVKGFPGGGKTYMANLHAQLRTNKAPLIIDCGGRNLQDLLWETIIDFDADPSFFKSLEERGEKGQLNPISKKILKDALGGAYLEEDGKVIINWDQLKNQDSVKGEGVTETDMNAIVQELEKVRALEFASDSHNALGLRMVPGIIYQGFMENRPIILDEYNKSKEGTDDAMQTMLQFLNGETDSITIQSPMKDNSSSGQSYTLKREDMGDLFFVSATGNAVVDGVSTRPLSESANQRWQPETIPNSTLEDWEHAWTQFSTGVPISTLYHLNANIYNEGSWENKPKNFVKFLKTVLTADKTEEEIAKIPTQHFDFIENWQSIMKACDHLATFCHEWTSTMDMDNTETPEDVAEEVREPEYIEEVAMGYRKVLMWLEEARFMIPLPKPADKAAEFDFTKTFKETPFVERYKKPTSLEFGDRLIQIIEREITASTKSRGKDHLFEYLMTKAAENKIIIQPTGEATQKVDTLVSDAFNVSPFKGATEEDDALIIRRELLEHLKEQDPQRFHNMDDEDILPLGHLRVLMGHLKTHHRPIHTREHSADVLLFNTEFGVTDDRPLVDVKTVDDTFAEKPKTEIGGYTIDSFGSNDNDIIEVPVEDLVSETQLLKTLVLPVIGEFNLRSFWNSALSKSGVTSPQNKSMEMAENTKNVPFATTTVMVRSEEGAETPLHIVKNNQTGALLIVGNDIDDRLREKFVLSHIHYVSRHEEDAMNKVELALDKITSAYPKDLLQSLKEAFLHRHVSTSGNATQDENRTLQNLLVANDIECSNKHYITHKKSDRVLKATLN